MRGCLRTVDVLEMRCLRHPIKLLVQKERKDTENRGRRGEGLYTFAACPMNAMTLLVRKLSERARGELDLLRFK